MLPPNYSQHFHASGRPRGGFVVFKQLRQHHFDRVGILVSESGFLSQLWIHAAVKYTYTMIYTMLHPHRVRAALGSITLAADALCNLGTGNVNSLNAESRLNSDRTAYTDRDAGVAFFVATIFLKRKPCGSKLGGAFRATDCSNPG